MLTITEKDFLATTLEMAELFGWRVHHVFEARIYAKRTDKGFPDLVLVKGSQVLYWELKSEKGKVSDDQQGWLDALQAAGQVAEVMRPSDRDRIQAVLSVEDGNDLRR